jgi:predicted SAM-dependent methyltransferase
VVVRLGASSGEPDLSLIRLNVGCGEYPASGWVNMDTHKDGPRPDITGSIFSIPLPDDSCSQVYCGHILEHLPLTEIPRALNEVRRVLAPKGELLIVGPDLTRAEADWPDMIEVIKGGEGRWPGDEHLWESREAVVVDLLEQDWHVVSLDVAAVSEDWPLTSRIGWQFAVLAIAASHGEKH